MPPEQNYIEPLIWGEIIDSIKDGSCVPFLGAGVNRSTDQYQGLPLANDVALQIVKRLAGLKEKQLKDLIENSNESVRLHIEETIAALKQDPGGAEIPDDGGPLPGLLKVTLPDLARVALQVEVKVGLKSLLKHVREILKDEHIEPSPLLMKLAAMRHPDSPLDATSSPFKLIVTANYDSLLERAFDGKPKELVVQPIAGFTDDEQKELERRLSAQNIGPILYKIHGSFRDTTDDRLILTEEDYIQFISVVGRQKEGVPELVTEKLVKGTILFLGYSLQDWDFRTIYKTLIESLPKSKRPRSYAIQLKPEAYWVKYWEREGKEVTILDVDHYWFAAELERRWQKEISGSGE